MGSLLVQESVSSLTRASTKPSGQFKHANSVHSAHFPLVKFGLQAQSIVHLMDLCISLALVRIDFCSLLNLVWHSLHHMVTLSRISIRVSASFFPLSLTGTMWCMVRRSVLAHIVPSSFSFWHS